MKQYCLLFIALCVASSLHAQSLNPYSLTTTSQTHSPTVTQLSDRDEIVAAATVGTSNCRVHVYRSTNIGGSWADVHTLALPTGYDNMDDAQLLSISSNRLLLAARVWKGDDAVGTDYNLRGQQGSVFYNSAVVACFSTDQGATWSDNSWLVVESVSGAHSGSTYYTVEHPRIAARPDYAGNVFDFGTTTVAGVITWEKREYVWNSTSQLFTSLPTTSIGLRGFSSSGLLAAITSYPDLNVTGTTITHPQRPSVALSPDGCVWLAFYDIATSTNWSLSKADYYATKATMSWNSGTSKLAFTFAAAPKCPTGADNQYLPGLYDAARGYFYCEEYLLHPNDFNIDFAQGPSVQVCTQEVHNCQPGYNVAFVYTYAQVHNTSFNDGTGGTNTNTERPIRLFYAHCDWGQEAIDLTWHYIDDVDRDSRPASSDYQMGLFPVLKWILPHSGQSAPPLYLYNSTGVRGPRESYFVLSFLRGYRCSGSNMAGNGLDGVFCRTGVSFDNTFTDAVFRDAGPSCTYSGVAATNTQYWGSKIDVAGQRGDFSIQAIWHNISLQGAGCTEDLRTNRGGAIFVQPYLANYPLNDARAYIHKSNMLLLTIGGTNVTKDAPYEYFDFNNIAEPTAVQIDNAGTGNNPYSPSSLSDNIDLGTFENGSGGTFGKDLTPSYPPSGDRYGLYWMKYVGTKKTDQGLLSYSDQRKIVATGSAVHAVFESNDKIWYTIGSWQPGGRLWSQPVQIEDLGTTTHTQLNPSIAVYQHSSDRNNPDGQAAVAVVWVEKDPAATTSMYSQKMRVREFNTCTGQWGAWSSVETISTVDKVVDNITVVPPKPVVAPLVRTEDKSDVNDVNHSKFNRGDKKNEIVALVGWNAEWNVTPTRLHFSPLLSKSWCRASLQTDTWGAYTNRIIKGPFVLIQPDGTNLMQVTVDFPTMTNTLNKFRHPLWGTGGEDLVQNLNLEPYYYIESAFTSDGGNRPVLTFNAKYYLKDGGNSNLSTNLIGTLHLVSSPVDVGKDYRNRNPSIVMNSSGEAFLAWEHQAMRCDNNGNAYYPSEIHALQQDLVSHSWNPKDIYTIISQNCPTGGWTCLRNPSVTGFPKTPFSNDVLDDKDLGSVTLFAWQQHDGTGALQNKIFSADYSEAQNEVLGVGNWTIPDVANATAHGQWSQAAFAPYTTSQALLQSNDVASPPSFAAPFQVGAFKLGAYDTLQPFERYHTETHRVDSTSVEFVWGAVYSTDLGQPKSQIKLRVDRDSVAFSSFAVARAAMFKTFPFILKNGSIVTYYRKPYEEPACVPPGGGSSGRLMSIIRLHHENGQIDTLEQMNVDTSNNASHPARKVSFTYGGIADDTVYLDVLLSVSGFSSDDSTIMLGDEFAYSPYTSTGDTTIALKDAGFVVRRDAGFSLLPVYPDPLASNGALNVVLTAPSGAIVTVEILNVVGQVESRQQLTMKDDAKQLHLPAPKLVGTYYVRASCNGSVRTQKITVQ